MAHRTERIWLQSSYNLMQYCHKSKNLYNYANYIFKKQLEYKYFTSAFELMDIVRHHPAYQALPSHTSQQIIKFLVKSWKGYFISLKAYKKNPKKYQNIPRPPNYKRKDGFHLLFFTSNQVKIQDGFLVFPKIIGMRIKTRIDKVSHVRIVPKGLTFLLEIIYDRPTKPLRSRKNIISVDLGLDNLITAVSNVSRPIIIKGTDLKSMNQWFNKKKALLTSVYKLQNPDLKNASYGQAMHHLLSKRYRRFEDKLHKISRKFINYCLEMNIDTIVLGYNEGWKQNINLGKKNNQNFVNIPFLNLIRKIEYKAEDEGIRLIRQEESYTSKCSFIDNEKIGKKKSYLGRRVKRGVFRSSNGVIINADCNGAGNIGRKVFPIEFSYGIVDAVSHPVCLSV